MAATPPADLAAMGEAARIRVMARHDIDICAAALTELLASKGKP